MLRAHTTSSKTTYAYYFTELYDVPDGLQSWTIPDAVKVGADHADELAFVFAHALAAQNNVSTLFEG